ncbi:LCP family protein required for cell wall assembly [Nocardioides cavernae]|uniref:LCP family protein required for cell wall assembly n=1 Tax=Nocardioides cavernae TaxID=1921566 RepID=A0A7Y9H0Z1_9ACTN|nr:LCP family protein [Nocardioides cavernae]NYE35079.1 LCP family protein required for cell wall assembly [Nocardioides cavernae]
MSALRTLVVRLALLAAVALVVPTSAVQPTTISLTTTGTVRSVDVDDDVLWVLALGSEAGPGQDVTQGLTDAIQLIGVRPGTGRAAAIGLPRDLWVEDRGTKLNAVLADAGPDAVADEVRQLVGIAPDLVLVTGTEGFVSMMGDLGPVEVDSPTGFTTDDGTVTIRPGNNTLDARQALSFATTRDELLGRSDFERVANHQRLLLAALARLRAAHDEVGFLERITVSALGGLDTDLTPTAAFRVLAALTLVDPGRTDGCIVRGTFGEEFGAAVVYPDAAQARAVGADAEPDARLQGGCRDGS